MANWPKHSILKALVTCILASTLGTIVQAADRVEVIETDIDRKSADFERIDTENIEISFPSVGLLSIEDFETGFIVNVRAAYHLNEHLFIEASYGVSEGDRTSAEELSPGSSFLSDDERDYTSWDVSLGVNIFPGETWLFGRAYSSDVYLVAGAGQTEFGNRDWSTINVGAGYRFFINDWLTFRFDVRDHIFRRDLLTIEKTTHNIELSFALSYFF